MKKRALLIMGALAVLGINSGMVAQAQSDDLIKESPKNLPEMRQTAYVAAVLPTTEAAITQFVADWTATDAKMKMLEEKRDSGETLTPYEQAWLSDQGKHSYAGDFEKRLVRRAEFYKRAHNWNGDNEKPREYSDVTLKAHVNSYGYDVLDAMNKELVKAVKASEETNHEDLAKQLILIVETHQSHIVNEEMRSYVNETVRYAATQTVKDKAADVVAEPASEHKVDLWNAIQNRK